MPANFDLAYSMDVDPFSISTDNQPDLAYSMDVDPFKNHQEFHHLFSISTDNQPDLAFSMDVDPNRNYSVWLHFAEIDPSVTGEGQRVFDILINGVTVFQEIDIAKLSGDINSALVLNTTVAVSGRSSTITLHPVKGSHAIISAIEIFEIVKAEAKTSTDEGTFSAILLFYFLNDFLNFFVLSIEKLKVIKDVNRCHFVCV